MRAPSNIDFEQYAQKLGADTRRLEYVFQKGLDVAGLVRSEATESFANVADFVCKHEGVRLVVGHPTLRANFMTVDAEGTAVVCMQELNESLDCKVSYYHELGHALFHAENYGNLKAQTEEILWEAEAELFAITVAIHDPTVTSNAMLNYLTEWGTTNTEPYKLAFDTALQFFKDNWVSLNPIALVETYGPTLVQEANDRILHEIARTPSRLNSIAPFDFEALMAKVFSGLGYEVEQTKRTRDGGIDILAIKSVDNVSLRFLIECKRYAEGRHVGVSLVRELFGVKHDLGASKAIIATTSDFTKPAFEFARAHQWELELKNRDGIIQWVNSYLTRREPETITNL